MTDISEAATLRLYTPIIPYHVEFSSCDAAAALALLSERFSQREEELPQFNDITDLVESDENAYSPFPIFDQLYNEGIPSAIQDLTIFTAHNFEPLWLTVFD